MQTAIIEEELERLLASKAFSRAGHLRRFLEYVVRQYLAGDASRLKEYDIGVAVFDRGPGFDPRIDTIVRVQAIKLRRTLESYFRSEGATEPIRIFIPKGSYRPVFELYDEQPTPPLEDAEALYWQAKYLSDRCAPDEIRRALRLLSHGTRRWPSNAALHTLLAGTAARATCSDFAFLAPGQGVPLMRYAARRALELDPRRGEAHFYQALPNVLLSDKSAVIEAMRHALAVSPHHAILHHWAAVILLADGKYDEALLQVRQAERLEPEGLAHKTRTAMVLLYSGKYDAATGYLRDVLEFMPDDYSANLLFSRSLCHLRRFDEARVRASRAYAASGTTNALAALGYVEACAGNRAAADKIIAELKKSAARQYVRPTGLAAIHVALGRMDAAAVQLSAALRTGDFITGWAKTDTRWASIRSRVAGI